MRIYRLYPSAFGGVTNKSIAYQGQYFDVVASSIKQAYWAANNRQWTDDPMAKPGLVQVYDRDRGYTVLGSFVGHNGGIDLKHSDGVRKVQAAVKAYLARLAAVRANGG